MSKEWNIMSSIVKQFKDKTVELSEAQKRLNRWRDWIHPEEVAEELGGEEVDREIVDQRRWSVVEQVVYKFPDDKYVRVTFGMAATENQENDSVDSWSVEEVEPKEVTTVKYVKVK